MKVSLKETGGFVSGRFFAPGRGFGVRNIRWMDLDWHILLIGMVLLSLGMLFVKAMAEADLQMGHGEVRFDGHLKKIAVAAPALLLGLMIRPSWVRHRAYLLYGLCIVLLALVPIIGDERNNARRWIELPGGFDLQPSELAKIGLILALGRALYRNRLQHLSQWGKPLLLVILPMGLVATQPDLGTALTIVPVSLGMLYLAGARASILIRFGLVAAGMAFAVFQFELGVRDYQMQRIETWLSSYQHEPLIEGRNGPAFHLYHARVAIGNGGWLGTGLGKGIANETGYLPERESDSIFAVIAEEGGAVGATGVLCLYAMFVILMMLSASSIRDRFSRLVVGGIAIYFGAHCFINVAVNLGVLPMTGLTLPLLSTGGSSLLASFTALGLALGMAAHYEPSLDQDAFRAY